MKALVKLRPEKGIWMEDVPKPSVGVNDVLIKIKPLFAVPIYTSINGTIGRKTSKLPWLSVTNT